MTESPVQLGEVFCVHRTAQGDAAALQGLDLELRPGEVLCVVGPSGAGKSTLLRVVAGIQLPSAGRVRVLGRDIGRLGPRDRAAHRHRHLGFLGQSSETALAPELSVRQAAVLPLALRGVSRRRREVRAEELLEAVGLRDRATAPPAELSGGERQRAALCQALAHSPAVLLADEPTGELDRESAELVYELMASLVRAAGASAIVVSHDPLVTRYADRTIGLRDGRVVEERGEDGDTLVVGRGGWVRLPDSLRAAAGLGGHLEPRVVPGGLLLSAIRGLDTPATPEPSEAPEPASDGEGSRFGPARVALESVRRTYRQGPVERSVLSGLTHAFAPGGLTVVTGRSGTGKTTLLRLIAGLDRPQAGDITMDGNSLSVYDAERLAALRRQRIGFMDQDPAPIGFLSAHENVVLALRIRGWDPHAAGRRASQVLDLVGLAERALQRVVRLSAGEIQRLVMARSLACARGLLILDEPTSRLDEANARRVAELVTEAATAEGHTVICASHDPALLARADELLPLEG